MVYARHVDLSDEAVKHDHMVREIYPPFYAMFDPVRKFSLSHFRDLPIPTFMVVTILLLIINISFNHSLLCLASFDLYCGSFAVYRVAVLVDCVRRPGAG